MSKCTRFLLMIGVVLTTLPSSSFARRCKGKTVYKVGQGIYDITGPAAETQMMGYALGKQQAKGIHMRLRSRAFIIESPCNRKRVVFVSVDLAQMFHSVRWGVIRKLKRKFRGLYNYNNVMISAIHTHQGIAGYSFCALFNMTGLTNGGFFKQGFNKQNYNAIVNGIYQSIVNAHYNMKPATIKMGARDLLNASMNRSKAAYNHNPWAERRRYRHDTDKRMTLVRFDAVRGNRPLGLINWFAVHATSFSSKHRHVNGDSKGLASYWFEKKFRTNYQARDTFVAAFAQANCGDVSPNLWGIPKPQTDYRNADIIAKRQYNTALQIYSRARKKLSGAVDFRHMFIDFSKIRVKPQFTGKGHQRTCVAAFGISFAAGSTEDGPSYHKIKGGKMVKEGWTMGRRRRTHSNVLFRPVTKKMIRCHAEKDIYMPIGNPGFLGNKFRMTDRVLPLQLFTIGQLAIAGVPFELTTMVGRRLRKNILSALRSKGITEVVIAGLSNAYSGYVTTRHEYAKQHYEGGSTHFGPWTGAALRQSFYTMAQAIRSNKPIRMGRLPRDLSRFQGVRTVGVVLDAVPIGKKFGQVRNQPREMYRRGQRARVVFWGAHLKNNLMTQRTYFNVERRVGRRWITVARDWDDNTWISWRRHGVAASHITIDWKIPRNAPRGVYRIRHFGYRKLLHGRLKSYSGSSYPFGVEMRVKHPKPKPSIFRKCPRGYFKDPNGRCYQCPRGYRRSIHPVTSSRACFRDGWRHAKYHYRKKVFKRCRRGTFFDMYRHGCWSCPAGHKRTVHHIKTHRACRGRSWARAKESR
mgnify:CR=1 FL=1